MKLFYIYLILIYNFKTVSSVGHFPPGLERPVRADAGLEQKARVRVQRA